MRFLFLLSCAESMSSTIATFLPDGSAQVDSSLIDENLINLDWNSPPDSSTVVPDPNLVSVASSWDAGAHLDANNAESLTTEPDSTDVTLIGDETPPAGACVEQSPGNVHRRGTGFCQIRPEPDALDPSPAAAEPHSGVETPPKKAPEKLDVPDFFTMPNRHAPSPSYDTDDNYNDDCPKDYEQHLCCQGPQEQLFRPVGRLFLAFQRVLDCRPCKYPCLPVCCF